MVHMGHNDPVRLPAKILLGAFAGFLIAFSLPPWGWWPLTFVGIALLDYLGVGATKKARFFSGWAAGLVWLAMGELWMFDLTAGGYVAVFLVFGAGYGLVSVVAGTGDERLALLPAGFVLFEWFRWSWPFGGVPLATLPMTQVDSPLAAVLPLGGALLLVAVTAGTGCALRLVVQRRFDMVGLTFGAVAVAVIAGFLAPTGSAIETLDVAVVQGGGPQRTRASVCENQAVFDRHRDATNTIDREVDLIMWPENVVNPIANGTPLGGCEDLFFMSEAIEDTAAIAREQGTVLVPGWFFALNDDYNVNFSTAISPEGVELDRYDKVRTVPFGEFVPLRGLIERFSSEVPGRDALPGTGPASIDAGVAQLGVSISWEIFFDSRGRAAIRDGGQILVNPTNGSSFWLTILQSQQIASSRLRAQETGRWVLQAAPTGFSGIIDPNGNVLERTSISEQAVLYGTVERREGLTLATRLGALPILILSLVVVVATHARRRRYNPVNA